MAPWPLTCVTPKQFNALSDADKELLEAITAACLAEVERQRLKRERQAADGPVICSLPAAHGEAECVRQNYSLASIFWTRPDKL